MGKNDRAGLVIFFVLLAISVFIVGCTSNASNPLNENKNDDINNKNSVTPAFKTVSTGSTDSGDVLVDLTPKGMENGKFTTDISMNTHSVDLSQFDLMEITALEYEGKAIKPISSPKLSGHHSSGELIFNTGDEIKNFKIIIKGIPAVEKRIFEWN